jgi:gliding motility-associated protein GldM
MSIPKEPRQIMINLMYLVLTAMLALNVSNEILHAFKIINTSVVRSNDAIVGQNSETIAAFYANEEMAGQKERIMPYRIKAEEIQKQTQQVISELDRWSMEVSTNAGGLDTAKDRDGDRNMPKRQDNIDASTLVMVEQGGGDKVKKLLEDYRSYLLTKVSDTSRNEINNQLPITIKDPAKTEDNPNGSWSWGTFHNMPVMAAITLFNKLKNDVLNSEAIVLQKLFDEANAKQIKFDAIAAIAVPKNSYVLAGAPVEASIMIAAYNKSVQPSIQAPGGSVTVQNGVGTWKGIASGTGLQTVNGRISLNLGGRTITEPFKFEYMVGSQGGSMQLDAMNIMYVGLDNPVTVSAAGYNMEDVSASFPGNPVVTSAGKGKYIVKPTAPGLITATVNAGGKTIHTLPIKVKYVPAPVAKVGGRNGGAMPAAQYRVQKGVEAALENFEFPVRAQVVSFDLSFKLKKNPDIVGPMKMGGAFFESNRDANTIHTSLKVGDRVFFDDIRVKMPDGRVINIGGLTFVMT